MLLAAGVAWAASCCAAGGAQPTTLGSCDALGLNVGVSGGVETGGWSSAGAWFPAGDDGGARVGVAASLMGRLAPWLIVGGRAPFDLDADRVDGQVTVRPGLGDALAWAGVETTWDRPTELAFDLGVGTRADPGADEDPIVLLGAARVSTDRGPWRLWGGAAGRYVLVGRAPADVELNLVVDRVVAGRGRLGLSVGLQGSLASTPTGSLLVGPSLLWAPTLADQLLFSLRAGLPVDGAGRGATSRVVFAVDWYHVLKRTPA